MEAATWPPDLPLFRRQSAMVHPEAEQDRRGDHCRRLRLSGNNSAARRAQPADPLRSCRDGLYRAGRRLDEPGLARRCSRTLAPRRAEHRARADYRHRAVGGQSGRVAAMLNHPPGRPRWERLMPLSRFINIWGPMGRRGRNGSSHGSHSVCRVPFWFSAAVAAARHRGGSRCAGLSRPMMSRCSSAAGYRRAGYRTVDRCHRATWPASPGWPNA